VGEKQAAAWQLGGRPHRARLLKLEGAEERWTAAEEPASGRTTFVAKFRHEDRETLGTSRCLATAGQTGLPTPTTRRRDLEAH
jgi:hypothetical protein